MNGVTIEIPDDVSLTDDFDDPFARAELSATWRDRMAFGFALKIKHEEPFNDRERIAIDAYLLADAMIRESGRRESNVHVE
jgi:hypothetical protein